MRYLLILIGLSFFSFGCGENGGGNEPGAGTNPKLSIGHVTLFEGQTNSNFNFQVNLSESSEELVTVDFATMEISAGENTDFIPQSGTLIFDPEVTNQTISIEVVGDEWKENEEEFKVVLSNPTNATISNAEGIGTIRDEDTQLFIDEDGYSTPLSYPGMTLVWNDEFNGTTLDPACWTREQGNHGWGNNEWQNYTDREENAYLTDGKLIIEAKEENFGGSNYTSARLITKDKKSFAFGRIDVRAILPEGQGVWPAIWMLGSNFSTVGWPACGEIDIMELIGHQPSTVHGTAHWGPQGQTFSFNEGEHYDLPSSEKFSDKYHVFSIIWENDKIEWYVNDNKFFSLTPNQVSPSYPFNAEFFFILNIAVGGNWPGYPDNTTQFPQQMIVDYIRVFQ